MISTLTIRSRPHWLDFFWFWFHQLKHTELGEKGNFKQDLMRVEWVICNCIFSLKYLQMHEWWECHIISVRGSAKINGNVITGSSSSSDLWFVWQQSRWHGWHARDNRGLLLSQIFTRRWCTSPLFPGILISDANDPQPSKTLCFRLPNYSSADTN